MEEKPQSSNCRSSRPEMFFKIGVSENFIKFIGKHLCESPLFNMGATVSLNLYLKRDSGTGAFLRIFKIFKNTFFTSMIDKRYQLKVLWIMSNKIRKIFKKAPWYMFDMTLNTPLISVNDKITLVRFLENSLFTFAGEGL